MQRFDKPRTKHICEIEDFIVSKQYWSMGIGSKIIKYVIDWARNNEILKLRLQVRIDNERAIGLYKKLGFVVEGEIKGAMKIRGQYFTDYLMGLFV